MPEIKVNHDDFVSIVGLVRIIQTRLRQIPEANDEAATVTLADNGAVLADCALQLLASAERRS